MGSPNWPLHLSRSSSGSALRPKMRSIPSQGEGQRAGPTISCRGVAPTFILSDSQPPVAMMDEAQRNDL